MNQIQIIKHEAPKFGLVLNMANFMRGFWEVFFPIKVLGEIIAKYIPAVVEVKFGLFAEGFFLPLWKRYRLAGQ
ncbi:MAG: hypothetical protein JKY15_06275 [Deltaproteobacteria bacterium]|nr:hypothetical protein [Deltaproteobacteria bacterium]